MSYKDSVAKLSSPIRELVLGATQDGTQDIGNSEQDKVEVAEWIDKIAQGDIVKKESLKDLDSQISPRTYVVSNHLTAADIALYGALHPVISKLQAPEYYSHPALTRYFDHIQSRPTVRKSASELPTPLSPVPFDFNGAPSIERKAEPSKKKGKATETASDETSVISKVKETVAAAATAVTDAVAPITGEAKSQKKDKKAKKEAAVTEDGGKKKTAAAGKAPAVAEDAGEPVPSMIDLRVGHIVDIMKHPDADGLYVEQIDLGEETGPRTVVSGLVNYIPIDQMRDKYLVAVCNLKPANMRGVKSFAMVLCATSKDGKEAGIELIQPPANSKPGDRVYFEGADFESATPLSQLNPKKKIFETIQPGFITLDSKEAAWVNPTTKSVHKIRTSEGVCLAPTLVGASLS